MHSFPVSFVTEVFFSLTQTNRHRDESYDNVWLKLSKVFENQKGKVKDFILTWYNVLFIPEALQMTKQAEHSIKL